MKFSVIVNPPCRIISAVGFYVGCALQPYSKHSTLYSYAQAATHSGSVFDGALVSFFFCFFVFVFSRCRRLRRSSFSASSSAGGAGAGAGPAGAPAEEQG